MQRHTLTLQAVSTLPHNLSNPPIKRIRKRNVSNNTLLKERPGTESLSPVNDLVRHHKVPGLDFLLQATDGREGDDSTDTDGAKGSDVGTGGDLMRRQLVVKTMATEECDRDKLAGGGALVVEDGNRRGGVTPRRRDLEAGNLGEAREFAQTGATDHGDANGVYSIQQLAYFFVGWYSRPKYATAGYLYLTRVSVRKSSHFLRQLLWRVDSPKRSFRESRERATKRSDNRPHPAWNNKPMREMRLPRGFPIGLVRATTCHT